MKFSPNLSLLIDALRALPGVGPKTAQRMAFHLLQDGRPGAHALATALTGALGSVKRCQRCRMLTEESLCSICASTLRDSSLLCVVESPADVVAVEQSGSYRGLYFVLMGHLSPLDGIGPEQLGARELEGGGQLIDAPGVRDFAPALTHLEERTLGFREIAALAPGCRFADCRHVREPDCAVRAAAESGALHPRRLESYRRLRRLREELAPRTPGRRG